MQKHCKHYCFQLEKGEGGYEHFQGRLSLKEKKRNLKGILDMPGRCTPTSNKCVGNFDYVMKEDTRIDGPWMDKELEEETYIPRQYRELVLKPWQQAVMEKLDDWDTRTINIIYDVHGNSGKSTFARYMQILGKARVIGFCREYKDIMRMVMDLPTAKAYFIDMPRAIKKEKLYDFWAALETVKDGYAFDDRYNFREKNFDCPNIWVFTNTLPVFELLSTDRWKVWTFWEGTLVSRELEEFEGVQTMKPAVIRQRKPAVSYENCVDGPNETYVDLHEVEDEVEGGADA